MSNWPSVPRVFLLFQLNKALEFGKDINRLIYLRKRCDVLTFTIIGIQVQECWEEHFNHFRNVIYHFWLHGLRCSKSFLQFLFVLHSCWVLSSNLEQRVLNQVVKADSGILRFQKYSFSFISLSFLFLLLFSLNVVAEQMF